MERIPSPEEPRNQPGPRRRHSSFLFAFLAVLVTYLVVAYFVAPLVWNRYAKRHPALTDVPGVTQTSDGHPGDPLNVALVGTEAELRAAMGAAQWDAADALGLRSDLAIAADTVLRRSYEAAPVSNLYLFGRKQDLAFEQSVSGDPRRRHHVRFWRAPQTDADGRPLWVGSVTYDERVGLSHTTGQITHHIAADVDTERDRLMATLTQTQGLSNVDYVDGF